MHRKIYYSFFSCFKNKQIKLLVLFLQWRFIYERLNLVKSVVDFFPVRNTAQSNSESIPDFNKLIYGILVEPNLKTERGRELILMLSSCLSVMMILVQSQFLWDKGKSS